jgi:hypothetical protein
MTMKKTDVFLGAALAALLMAPVPVLAAGAMDEITTAQTHAELAGAATDPNYTYMHMHHTLNCLVGPGGNGFDAKMLNPCANAGNGAIPDMADGAKKAKLEALAQLSRDAIAAKDWAVAKKDAADVAAQLKAFK